MPMLDQRAPVLAEPLPAAGGTRRKSLARDGERIGTPQLFAAPQGDESVTGGDLGVVIGAEGQALDKIAVGDGVLLGGQCQRRIAQPRHQPPGRHIVDENLVGPRAGGDGFLQFPAQ